MVKLPTGVVLQPHGRFRAWVPSKAPGGKKWLPGSFATARDAAAIRKEVVSRLKDLSEVPVTLGRAIEIVEADYVAMGQHATLGWFRGQVKVLLRFLDADQPMWRLSAADVRKLRDGQLERGKSPASIGHRRRALSIVCNEMVRRGMMDRNPTKDVKWPKAYAQPFQWIPSADLKKLLGQIPDDDRRVIELAFQTGLRRTELSRLQADHVGESTLVVHGKSRVERLSINQRAQELLKNFPFGITPDQISSIFKRWQKALGEPRLYPHAMRHSYAMALRESGHDIYAVSRLLRHSSIEVTKVYFHDEGITLRDDLLA